MAVLSVLLVGALAWLVRSLPEIIAAQIGRLTNTQTEVGALDLHWNGSVSVNGLLIRPRQPEPGYDNAILRAKTVSVRVSRRSLVSLSPRVTDLRIEDFTLDAQFDLDTGRWNLGALRFHRPPGAGGGAAPTIRLERGMLRYAKVAGGKAEVVMSVPVEAQFGEGPGYQGYSFDIKTARLSGGYGESHLTGHLRPGEFVVTGGLSSGDLPSLERAWAVDVLAAQFQYDKNGDYTLDLRMKNLHGKQSPQVDALREILPAGAGDSGPLAGVQRFFARYRPTGTVGSISVNARGNLQKLRDSEITGTLVCTDVSACDVRFPYQLDHLAGDLDFTQSGMFLRQLTGKHGDVDVQIEGWTKGFGAERQYHYKVTSGNMILDETLYAALQPGQKRLWERFQPSGVVAADYRLARTSPTDKRMYLSVDLQGVAARFREFPYPLTGLTGRLFFDHDSISATDVVSAVGDRRIRLNAKVTGGGTEKPIHYVFIDANNVPLDTTLEGALPAPYRRLYDQLQVEGVADVRGRVFSTGDANRVGPTSFLADVVCRGKSLQWEPLPVVLSDVTAALTVSPELVQVKELRGRYEHSRVALTGSMQLAGQRGLRQRHARIVAEEVPINAATIDLLPEPLARQMAAFEPQGNVNLTLDVQKADGNEPPDYALRVECLGVDLHHRRFPYPLRNVRGDLSLAEGRLVLKDVTAAPGEKGTGPEGRGEGGALSAPRIQIDGSATLAPEGLVDGSFSLKAKDLLFTEELGDALPKGLTGLYDSLSPQGPFDLDLPTLKVARAAEEGTVVEFAGTAALKTCGLRVSGTPMELTGTARVEGTYGTQQGLATGRVGLAAQSLTIKGKTITDMTLNAVYDPNVQAWSARDFLGLCHGGKILGSLEVAKTPDGTMQYQLQTAFHRVNLNEFLQAGKNKAASDDGGARPDGPGPVLPNYPAPASDSAGTMNGLLSLGGRLGESASRRGVCQIDIVDMRVGRVSPVANLLSVLSLNEPADYTFDRMLIDSYIKQDKLLIRKLDLSGRNVAFTGSGAVALPKGELNLTLTARGRRVAAAEPSMLQALTEGLGGAVVRMEVTGKVDNPRVQTKTLPVIEDSLKILGTPE